MSLAATEFPGYNSIERIDNEATAADRSVESTKEDQQISYTNTFKGIAYSCISGVMYALTSVFVKMENGIDAGEIVFIRMIFIAFFSLPFAIYSREKFFVRKTIPLLLFSGLAMSSGSYFRYEAYQRLPLATANVIVFCTPVVVSILAIIFLKETVNKVLFVSLVITTTGLLVTVVGPSLVSSGAVTDSGKTFGYISAFCTLFINSAKTISLAKLKVYHYSVLNFYNACEGVLLSGVLVATYAAIGAKNVVLPDPASHQPALLLILSACSFLAVMFQTAALHCEKAGAVVICRTTADIVSAFLFQVYVFHEDADSYTISGAVLITCGGFIITLSKWYYLQPETSRIRLLFTSAK